MLSDSKINANYLAYLKRLEKYGCYSEEMINDIGKTLKMPVSQCKRKAVLPIRGQ